MKETKLKAMQNVIDEARNLLGTQKGYFHTVGDLTSALYAYDQIPSETESTTDERKGFANAEAKLLAAEKLARAAEALLRVPVTVSAIREEYALRQSLHDFYTADTPVCINNPFAAVCNEEKERAKVGDVVMHKHDSPGLHMCAVEGVNLTVEEATDRYISVRGDGVRSKWIRIDHGSYTIIKRAEPKRTPQVGEFWRHTTTRRVKLVVDDSGMSVFHVRAWGMSGKNEKCPDDWWREDHMEFAFPARKDGEFKIGDEVSVYGASATVQRIDESSLVHISFAERQTPLVRISTSHLTLKVPAEMQG